MAKEKTIMAFALNQTGIIIVRNMSSTDRRQQNRTMRTITGIIMAKRTMAKTTVTVTGNRSDENKEKQRPWGMVILSERHVDCHCSHNKNRTSHLCVRCFYSPREQHSLTRKSCMNTILSMLNCVAVKDLFSRPSAGWCLCTCINVSHLWH